MFANVKAHLFTVDGILITLVHVFVTVGFITCAIFFQTEILGHDPFGPRATVTGGKR
jgi:hypothetical protein